VSVGYLHGESGDRVDHPVDTQPAQFIPKDDLQDLRSRPDFRIFASAEGGPGQIIVSTEPVDFQPRPTILQNVRDAYGLIITGDSMWPEYRSGDTALVNPHLPAIGDEVYVFYAEREGEARATIKHLRRATAEKWLVSQWNPPAGMDRDFTLSRREWRVAHRVLGKYARR
jgi:phage repressor protein C with HTH and peptisase S24 domain